MSRIGSLRYKLKGSQSRGMIVNVGHHNKLVGGRFSQHAAAMQILENGGGCRFVWTSDESPDTSFAGAHCRCALGKG